MLASSWLQDSMLGTACSGISVARTDCGSHLSLESQHGDIQDVDTGLYSCHSSSSAHYEGENRQNMYFWQQRDSRGGESMTAVQYSTIEESQAFQFFDRNQTGYIRVQYLEVAVGGLAGISLLPGISEPGTCEICVAVELQWERRPDLLGKATQRMSDG
ncbi:hypothetical protein MLD38_007439 [Melastoma candidum]|uniref:Uncharacterized protein n=1 Tax=Melastoma candidum TaxID=119954 RepID=A0ACB9RQL3_9MYRT|nr:hypothetical protein MLD38_007439 [Melastoma candidum]